MERAASHFACNRLKIHLIQPLSFQSFKRIQHEMQLISKLKQVAPSDHGFCRTRRTVKIDSCKCFIQLYCVAIQLGHLFWHGSPRYWNVCWSKWNCCVIRKVWFPTWCDARWEAPTILAVLYTKKIYWLLRVIKLLTLHVGQYLLFLVI